MHFRVDANATVGSGHLMRCLSVADALRRLGCDSCFVLSDAGSADIVAARGYGFHVLGSRYDELDSETDRLHSLLSAEAATSLLVDSYFATETYMASLKRSVRLLYLDDLAAIRCPVDVLVNYNSYADGLGYERTYAGTETELLLGCAYAPLREEFRDLPERPASSSVRQVYLSTGGSDPTDFAHTLLSRLVGIRTLNLQFHLVIGRLSPNRERLETLARTLPQVRLHVDLQRVSEVMSLCDVAISASGSTLYELFACGVPTVGYVLADNQQAGMADLATKGLILPGGDVRTSDDAVGRIVAAFLHLSGDPGLRATMSSACRSLVDGKGAERIARRIVQV
jgi:UDP-2,4-diacetamido-2,4,6-trideoxy-beta-L-altropyranose hydrolase